MQMGAYANFVGAHYWNLQDELLGPHPGSAGDTHIAEIDSNVLYRVGETYEGMATYTPRLIAVDVKGSLGAVKSTGTLYEPPSAADLSSVATWNGPLRLHKFKAVQKTAFQVSLEEEENEYRSQQSTNVSQSYGESTSERVDSDRREEVGNKNGFLSSEVPKDTGLSRFTDRVQYWTDYLKAPFHPSTVLELKASWGGDEPFAQPRSYVEGLSLMEDRENVDEIGERVRMLAEGCDNLQAFQFSVDETAGFSAISAEVLGELDDDYSKVSRLLFSLQPPETSWGHSNRLPLLIDSLTSCLSFAVLSSQADLYVPLGRQSLSGVFSNLLVDETRAFHSSAVYAAALDSLTMPYRLSPFGGAIGAVDAASLVRLLAQTPTSKIAFAAMSLPAPSLAGGVRLEAASLAPVVEQYKGKETFAEALVIRDRPVTGTSRFVDPSIRQRSLQSSLQLEGGRPAVRHVTLSQQPLAIPYPFPPIFRSQPDQGEVSILTRLGTGPLVLPLIEIRLEDLRRHSVQRTTASSVLGEWGFPKETRDDLIEHLQGLVNGSSGRFSDELT